MELLQKASERVTEINKLMREVEKTEKVIGGITGLEVAMTDRTTTTYLTDILTKEELDNLYNIIINIVRVNGAEARAKLEAMIGVSTAHEVVVKEVKPEVKKEVEPVVMVDVKIEDVQPKKAGRTKAIDYEKASSLFKDGMPIKDIAAELGCDKSSIYNYFKDQGITNKNTPSVEYIGKYGKKGKK